MPDLFRFGASTSLSVRSLGDGWVEVSCAAGGSARLAAQVPASVWEGLQRLDACFTRAQLADAVGTRRLADRLLSRLLTHRLVHAVSRTDPHASDEPAEDEFPEGVVPLRYRQAAIDGERCGFGVAATARQAAISARGEAWERHALLRPDLARPEPQATHLPSWANTPGLLVDFLRDAAPLSPARYPALTERVVRRCTGGSAVGVFPGPWIYPDASPAANSNGVASGPTLARAIVSARQELIERDALLRAWYGLAASRPIEPNEGGHASLRTLRGHADAVGLKARWFVLGSGPVWTVACVLSGTRAPHLGLGSAARVSIGEAAMKAFLEAAGSHLGHVLAHRQLGARSYTRHAIRLADRAPERFHRTYFEAFWAGQPVEAAREIARRLSQSRARAMPPLNPARFHWLDLTTRDASRRHVVKVVHPDAVPLPNTMAQVRLLERLLGVHGDGTPPPIS